LPRPPPPQENVWENLARFGFAMASSRNPSFFGQLGEAGINLQEQRRAARQEARQEAELELNRAYREAQLNFERAKLEAEQNPRSVVNIYRLALAQANLLEAQARLQAAAQAGASAREIIPGAIEEGDNDTAYGITRGGQRVLIPGARYSRLSGSQRADQRELNDWRMRRQQAETLWAQRLFPRPESMMEPSPAQRAEFDRRMDEWDRANPRPGTVGQNNEQQRQRTPSVVIGPDGRPIR
jgi:hypothetical protein